MNGRRSFLAGFGMVLLTYSYLAGVASGPANALTHFWGCIICINFLLFKVEFYFALIIICLFFYFSTIDCVSNQFHLLDSQQYKLI